MVQLRKRGIKQWQSTRTKKQTLGKSTTVLQTGRAKFVDPLIKKLKEIIKEVFYRYYHALDSYHRLNNTNANLYRENERLSKINDRLTDENTTLRAENKDFRLLRKVFGSQQIDALISQAKEQEQQRKHTKQPSNQRTKRIRNNDFER